MLFKDSLRTIFLFILFLSGPSNLYASDPDYDRLWFTYEKSENGLFSEFGKSIKLSGSRYDEVIQNELNEFFSEVYGIQPEYGTAGSRIIMVREGKGFIGKEGFEIVRQNGKIEVRASDDAGFLYGCYSLIRLMRTGELTEGYRFKDEPKIDRRLLDHWDNINGTIERGYAGKSIWKWEELPDTVSPRYEQYARANASIGINGIVLNNVNASPLLLTSEYLKKITVLAKIFRRYNIRLYLSANFASPMKPSDNGKKYKDAGIVAKLGGGIGNLETADPMNVEVIDWWREKVDEIYREIPDFGGFLVKANSEGMAGPHTYNRTIADGANMLARVLKPHGGIVMWRAFVLEGGNEDPDRLKKPYMACKPMDGMFDDNVMLQVKNTVLDFRASEPISPLFGAMKKTQVMAELQITQEYMGHSTSLVYLLPMWKQFFQFDTHCKNVSGCTVSRILQGEIWPQKMTAMAGVGNVGDDYNWCGHYFAQANWYAFGRLAWNPDTDADKITAEWVRQTWNTGIKATETIKRMMYGSWESFMKSACPYGIGITTDAGHYRADFEGRNRARNFWTADTSGVGRDRTATGSNLVSQYLEPNKTIFSDLNLCPEELLLCFHFVKWDHIMPSGERFSDVFMETLKSGIRKVNFNIRLWKSVEEEIDEKRYNAVLEKLQKEKKDTEIFYNAAVAFFKPLLK